MRKNEFPIKTNLEVSSYLAQHYSMTTFPVPCTYFCYNILLTNAPNTGFRIISVCLTHFRPFAQDKSFIKWVFRFNIIYSNKNIKKVFWPEHVGMLFFLIAGTFYILSISVVSIFVVFLCRFNHQYRRISCTFTKTQKQANYKKLFLFLRGFWSICF